MLELEAFIEREERLFEQRVIAKLRRDLRYAIFYLSPKVKGSEPYSWEDFARKIDLPMADARAFQDDLFKLGLWRRDEEGAIVVSKSHLDLGELSVLEFVTLSIQIFANLSETGPCWYETFLVPTNQNLKKKFFTDLNKLIRDFVKASSEAEADTVLAWTHSSLDSFKNLPRNPPLESNKKS